MTRGATSNATFTEAERAFLTTQRLLGRLGTVDPTGQPHVVPGGWAYNAELGTIDIGGRDLARTRKFRNVRTNPKVCLVVDDVLPPWRPRCVQIRGDAEALDAAMTTGDGPLSPIIRITPTKVASWGLDA